MENPQGPPLVVIVAGDMTTTHPGRSLDEVIAGEMEGFAARRAAFLGRNPDERAYLASEDDHSIWLGSKLRAVVLARPGGVPEVVRLDWTDPGPPADIADDNPSDPATRGELAWRSVDLAVARYREARRWAALACRLDSGPRSNPWAVWSNYRATDAESDLIAAIRCLDPGVHESDIHKCQHRRWGPRGVRMHGRLYLAIPSPDDDAAESKYWIMRLAVVEASAIVDLDRPGATA